MDLSSKCQHHASIRRRIPPFPPSNRTSLRKLVVLVLTVLVQQISVASAYTCSQHNGRSLLCRHGTKSTSGVFDARRIKILLYLQEKEEQKIVEEFPEPITSIVGDQTNANVLINDHHNDPNKDHVVVASSLSKREKLQRLLKHMRSVAPKLRICLPSFMARIKSIEKELKHHNDNDDDGSVMEQLATAGEEELTTTMNGEIPKEEEEEEDDRSATAASHVDLSGTWRPIVTPEFKLAYDQYLQNCSQSYMYRKIIVNGISLQKEIIQQLEEGTDLQIVASNPAGNWNRTLVASSSQDPVHVTILDPDGDKVQVEAWWEDHGRVHRSWLRNKPRLLGGAFETARYLSEEDPNILLVDSIFHPSLDEASKKKFQYGRVLWKFERV